MPEKTKTAERAKKDNSAARIKSFAPQSKSPEEEFDLNAADVQSNAGNMAVQRLFREDGMQANAGMTQLGNVEGTEAEGITDQTEPRLGFSDPSYQTSSTAQNIKPRPLTHEEGSSLESSLDQSGTTKAESKNTSKPPDISVTSTAPKSGTKGSQPSSGKGSGAATSMSAQSADTPTKAAEHRPSSHLPSSLITAKKPSIPIIAPSYNLDLPEESLLQGGRLTTQPEILPKANIDIMPVHSDIGMWVTRLRSGADNRKNQVQREAKRVNSEISAKGMEQKDIVHIQLATELATIRGEIALTRSVLGAEGAKQKREITKITTTGFSDVLNQTQKSVNAISALAEDYKKRATNAVTSRQESVRKFGADEGKRGKEAIDKQAQEALARGNSKAASYPNDGRGRAQATAVLEVAHEVSNKLAEPGPKLQSDMEDAGAKLAKGIDGANEQVTNGIDSELPKVTLELSKQAQTLGPKFNRIETEAHKGVNDYLTQVNGELRQIEIATIETLRSIEAQVGQQIDEAVVQIQGIVGNETDAITTAIDSLVEKTIAMAERDNQPNVSGVQSIIEIAEDTLNQAADQFLDSLSGTASASDSQLAQGGRQVTSNVASLSNNVASTLAQITTVAVKGLVLLSTKAKEASDQISKEWNKILDDTQKTIDAKYKEAISSMETAIDKGLTEGKSKITTSANQAITKNKEPLDQLDAKMEEAAEKAREKYDAPWYKKVGRWLLSALWGILKAVLMLILVIALLIIAVLLILAESIVAVIAGIILLVAVLGYLLYKFVENIINRISSANSVGGGIWGFFVGILDITGLPGMVEGLIQHDIVNGRELTVEEAGERFGGGLVGAITFFLPFIKALKGRGVKPTTTELPRTKPATPEPTTPEPTTPEPTTPEPTTPEPTTPEPTTPEPTTPEPTTPEPTTPEPTTPEPTTPKPEEPTKTEPRRPEEPSVSREFPKSWDKFDADHNLDFKEQLHEFRGTEDLKPSPGLRGGEGQLFLSPRNPFLTLKRWFATRLKDMGESIRKLKEAKNAVDANPKLKADIEVVEVYKQGSDFVLRDFDPTSIPLKNALGDTSVAAARSRAISALEGTTDPMLSNILGKLRRNSENVHWSPAKQKIVIIDMQ
jgi:hypothetical protein